VFSRYGAAVVIADLQTERAERAAASLAANHAPALAVTTDIADSASVRSLFQRVSAFGQLTTVVNNATSWYPPRLVEQTSDDEWDQDIAVMLKGQFIMAREALKSMKSGGSFVNIASVHAMFGSAGHLTYDTFKGGVVQMTRVMAAELGKRGIRANAISPGIIDTERSSDEYRLRPDLRELHASMCPLNTIGEVSDIGEAAAFLASDRARFITGQTLVVDGGLTSILQITAVEGELRRRGIE
jgi:NAD(P)-dependent dehydrogenase (short-subunit alcohol dehydrogenase family)